jgi:excinuclease ABC subunit A
MGCLVTITGVSGSGKSSFLMKEIYPSVKADAVILDQSPIYSTKYSIPATYLGIYSRIRTLFSKTPLAREKGLSQAFFSLAKKGGRCEKCRGLGFILHDLEFLPPVRSSCNLCAGKRFNREVLEIKFKGLNMADVLDLDMEAAARLFSHMPSIRKPIEAAERAGLGYIKLGQPVSTLSGGENQRLKLAKELSKIKKGHIFYLFDELSRGLHPSDMEKILKILDELLDEGHTIVAIEHDPQVLSVSDWIIALGPGGGPDGGKIIFEGKHKSNTFLKY